MEDGRRVIVGYVDYFASIWIIIVIWVVAMLWLVVDVLVKLMRAGGPMAGEGVLFLDL